MPVKKIEPFECPICLKGTIRDACIAFDVPIRERVYTVSDAEVMQCDACGEVFFAPGQGDALQRKAADTARPVLGLVTGKEIVDFRKSLGLTQAELERAMAIPPKTLARWEIGTVLQSCAADRFLRVLMAHPELVAELLAQDEPRKRQAAAR